MIIIHLLGITIYYGYTGKSLFFKGAFLSRAEMSRQHTITVDSYLKKKTTKIFKNIAGSMKKESSAAFSRNRGINSIPLISIPSTLNICFIENINK